MTNLIVKPSKGIKGEIHIPGDKSISHRAIMIGSLAKGETIINGFLPSADCLATVECFRKLGIDIQMTNGCKIIIDGKGLKGLRQTKELLDVGNSGTTIRLISGILAGQPFLTKITGDESIQKRPMMRIVRPLREMGAGIVGHVKKDNIYAPLEIDGGNLTPIEYELPVASAQVKSAVLLAGLFAKGETSVIEKNKARNHTERMLSHFGADIRVQGMKVGVRGMREFRAAEVDVPGDISSAAFFIVAAAIVPDSELLIKNVGVNPTRTGIIDVLHRMGADIQVMNEQLIAEEPRADILVKSSKLKGIKIDGSIVPRIIDEIPIIAVAATQAEGTTEIRGARELRIKESDRLATISMELKKMGANIKELDDGLIIKGPTAFKAATVDSCGDHRIAMSAAIAGLAASGETTIENTDCIETSFPGFGKLLASI
ncbi:MAG: 3-phosphoshikimate 1-carboxyvinyltransferase [Candidatus Margulisbacteria bacterium]|nr:3-phosphoshikimate 1-carboxyvinyltransferase [Candidatus Margulisiibacteriota bacterium]